MTALEWAVWIGAAVALGAALLAGVGWWMLRPSKWPVCEPRGRVRP